MQPVKAIYENGVLRPLTPLNLPERTEVHVTIEEPQPDPFFDLIGAFESEKPLIDGIAVSEDPDLYLVAAQIEDSESLHAWEIAPARYKQGENGEAVRINS